MSADDVILKELSMTVRAIPEDSRKELCGMFGPERRVFVVGVGRVLLSLQAFAKRLNHLGIEAYCVGDINEPALRPNDILLVGSGSGSSRIPLTIAEKADQLGAFIVHIGATEDSPMSKYSDLYINIPTASKTGPGAVSSVQPMTSLFEQSLYLFLDSVCFDIWSSLSDDARDIVVSSHANLE